MKLEKPITLRPRKYTDSSSNKLVSPSPITLDVLNVAYTDNPTSNSYYAYIEKVPSTIILWKNSDYTNAGPINRVMAEAKLREVLGPDPEQYLQNLFPMTLEEDPDGPGSILTGMISTLGIKSTSNCSCRRHALEMNEKGPQWCEENIDTILGWLKDESKKRGLPYVETVARMMVNKAISKSVKLKKRNSTNQ